MADAANIDEILNKFAGNEINSKEFLNLLFTSDQTGVDYLQNLKKEFKEKYVLPVYQKSTDYYGKLSKKLDDPSKQKSIDNINDPLGINDLHEEYKEKTKELLDKKLKEFGDSINVDKKNPLKDSAISSIIPERTQNVAQEQATLTPKESIVKLSKDSINEIAGLFTGLNLKNLKTPKEREIEKEEDGGSWMSGLLKMLAIGGIGAMLVSVFWESHIKPWLEDQLDMKLGFLDRFEGTIEAIGKFFSMGALKVGGGWLFNLVGKAFTTFGELLEGGLTAIFKLGFGDDVVKAGTQAAPAVWKTLLPKIAGSLFKGAGVVALRGVPILGSLISFYFAYDRFQKGENMAGFIDIASGIAGLVPGFGTPLSIGLSALNAFLDYKAGSADTIEGKENIRGDYIEKIVKFVQEIPFIGGLIKWGRGFWELGQGNFREALNYLTETPFLGPFPAILQSLVNSNAFGTEGTDIFSFEKFNVEIKKSMFRWMCSFVPAIGGIRGQVANWMGLQYDDKSGELVDKPFEYSDPNQDMIDQKNKLINSPKKFDPTEYSKEKEDALKKEYDDAALKVEQKKKEFEKIKEKSFKEAAMLDQNNPLTMKKMFDLDQQVSSANSEYERSMDLKLQKLKIYESYFKSKPKEEPKEEKKDDFSFRNLLTSNQENSILFDKNTNTANILNENDNILAYKSDGVFDKALQEITKLVASINRGVYQIPNSLENIQTQSPSMVIANGGGGGSSDMGNIILGGTRDAIYSYRVNNRYGSEFA